MTESSTPRADQAACSCRPSPTSIAKPTSNPRRTQTPHHPYQALPTASNLYGIEVNESLAQIAKLNLASLGCDPASILRHDALDFIANISSHNPGFVPDSFDLVLANPPWGITIRRSEREAQYLDQYELQNFTRKRWPTLSKPDSPEKAKPRASARSEILFLERIHSLLKPGTGRAAIIVPMGILASDMLQGVRNWLLHHFQIQGVIQLPNHTFYSSGLNVGAGIIFVRRLDSGETNPEDALVFMAMLENIGFDDHGRNTFKITAEQATDTLKTERHQSDLFDYRISFARDAKGGRHRAWIEQHRDIIPGTGLIGLWESFQDSPKSFLI